MRGWVEAPAFLTLAVLLHLALFGLHARPPGVASSGADGTALLSIEAAAPGLSALVERWERKPKVHDDLSPPPPPPVPTTDTPKPTPASADRPRALAAPQIAPSEAPALSDLPVIPAPPPRMGQLPDAPGLATSVRPRERPFAAGPPSASRAKRPPPAQPSQPSRRQRAAGNGDGAHAGQAGAAKAATLTQSQRRSLMAEWGAGIRARVERRKHAPAVARRARGTVTVALGVGRDGGLLSARISRSSGQAALDAAALSAVRRAAPFARAPAGLTKPAYSFTLPIRFAP